MSRPSRPADRRRALRRFMDAHNLKAGPWAKAARLAESTLYNFLRGDTDSLNQRTLEKLAANQSVPVSVLIGEGRDTGASEQSRQTQPGPFEPGTAPWIEALARIRAHLVLSGKSADPASLLEFDFRERQISAAWPLIEARARVLVDDFNQENQS